MPKDIPVGNGSLLLNFDSDYRIRDIFYPYVGQENHTNGHPFPIGVWVDGQFSWVGADWKKDLRYRNRSLVTDVTLENEKLALTLRCSDVVDLDLNVYVKKLTVVNSARHTRQARIFFGHDFYLYGNDIGGTAYFDPRSRSLIHYKVHRYFLMSCCVNDDWGVSLFTCGRRKMSGLPAPDDEAQTGKLSGAPSAWGSPYSTLGIQLDLPSRGSSTAYYWIAAGTTYREVADLNLAVHEKTPEMLIERSAKYWALWLGNPWQGVSDLPETILDIYNRSLLVLKSQIDNHGAIIAANDSDIIRFGKDTYSYMWGRDGAFAAAALAKAGFAQPAMEYFNFCAKVLSPEGYLFQHYNPDGSLASNWHPWLVEGREVLPIQEDSTALTLWALWIHYARFTDIEFIKPLYSTLIKKAADFLVRHRDDKSSLPLPSYDLWEERYAVHTHTVAAVIAGLRAAANFARLFGDDSLAETYADVAGSMKNAVELHLYDEKLKRYTRSGIPTENGSYSLDETVDVSVISLSTLGVLDPDDPRMRETVAVIQDRLWIRTPIQGCARYEGDDYQRAGDCPSTIPGNPWFISTLWLAEYFIDRATDRKDLQETLPFIEWCVNNALQSGILAEQVHPITGAPLCVSPLTWSHSALVWTVLRYTEKAESLKNKTE